CFVCERAEPTHTLTRSAWLPPQPFSPFGVRRNVSLTSFREQIDRSCDFVTKPPDGDRFRVLDPSRLFGGGHFRMHEQSREVQRRFETRSAALLRRSQRRRS